MEEVHGRGTVHRPGKRLHPSKTQNQALRVEGRSNSIFINIPSFGFISVIPSPPVPWSCFFGLPCEAIPLLRSKWPEFWPRVLVSDVVLHSPPSVIHVGLVAGWSCTQVGPLKRATHLPSIQIHLFCLDEKVEVFQYQSSRLSLQWGGYSLPN